jgi:integrase
VEPLNGGPAGATEITDAEVKGKIVEFLWWLKKQGYKPDTILTRVKRIRRLAKLRANLFDPEDVKDVIARQDNWCDGSKAIAVVAYSSFLKMLGKTWYPPRYKIREKLPFIPLESEVDALINSCGRKMACFLQGLKDTGADPGELARLEWTDINYDAKSVTIRHPVKGHSSRVVRVSDLFLRRLSAMPKKGSNIFCSYRGLRSSFHQQRMRCARDLSNPRILKITFRTLRHWKGTMEYHKTKDILHVKRILGHKNVQNTMIYINLEAALFQIRSDEFTVRVAQTLDEACEFVEAGFNYVTDMDGDKIFRKRK